MASRSGKVSPGAAFPLVDMEPEKSCFTSSWQTGDPRLDKCTSALLIKPNTPGQLRCSRSATDLRHRIRTFSAILHQTTPYQTMPLAVFCNRRGFEHRAQHRSVVEKFFSKVLKISRFLRFGGHCILKNAALSTGCYPIMGQNMGQTVSVDLQNFSPNFSTRKTQEKVLKYCDFRAFYGISHVILLRREKMQRIITERCIRYSTKVGLSPASTTTLPLLDTKIAILSPNGV